MSTVAWSLTSDLVVLRLTSVSVTGRGEFGVIPESGSQSQTRGTSIIELSVSGWREQLL